MIKQVSPKPKLLKTTIMKTKILALGFFAILSIVSCNRDDKETNGVITADEASVNSKIDIASDDVTEIVESEFNETQNNAAIENRSSGSFSPSSRLLICATVTRVPAFGTQLTPGTEVTKTITFGNENGGCTLANGNVVQGTIIITFTYQPTATSPTINYEFVNFFHNQIELNGNRTFTRTLAAQTLIPTVVMNMNMTATFPDGRIFTRVGTRTRTIIAGFDTPAIWIDDRYQVTGSWTTTFPNTTIQTSTITTPLTVRMSCREVNKPLLVQGVITFQRNGNSATLDYGTGECDNLAVFTINGNSYNIVIGN
jgi:hypothetical protein